MSITITVFDRSPDGGRGLARDTRVRWALEELGLAYAVRRVDWPGLKAPAHLALQPFGQIPTFEDGSVSLFESGAIVLHLASVHPGLLPTTPAKRARALSWLFAALNTVEPPILELANARLLEAGESWAAARLPLVETRVHQRLAQLGAALGDADWLAGDFSAADLMMVSVLQRVRALLAEHPGLQAYVARAEARPAWARAYAAQHALNTRP
jgi:glutathione S-transferase